MIVSVFFSGMVILTLAAIGVILPLVPAVDHMV